MQLTRLNSERKRIPRDFYETPEELARDSLYLLANYYLYLNKPFPKDVLDAGYGNGIWGKYAKDIFFNEEKSPFVMGVDIQDFTPKYKECFNKLFINTDFLTLDLHNLDLVIGNPPYSLAQEFIEKSFENVIYGGMVFFLLRLDFLESKKRYYSMWKNGYHPRKVWVLSRRPSFFSTGNGRKTTDALSYGLFLWEKGYKGQTILDWFYWEYD